MNINSNSRVLQNTIMQASSAVKDKVESLPDLTEEQKRKVSEAIDTTNVPAAEVPNTLVYWIAVGAVATVAGAVVLGGLYLAATGKETPNFLQTVLATAIGALAGMVVPSPNAGL